MGLPLHTALRRCGMDNSSRRGSLRCSADCWCRGEFAAGVRLGSVSSANYSLFGLGYPFNMCSKPPSGILELGTVVGQVVSGDIL